MTGKCDPDRAARQIKLHEVKRVRRRTGELDRLCGVDREHGDEPYSSSSNGTIHDWQEREERA